MKATCCAAGIALATLLASAAEAATFSFTFSNEDSTIGGTVEGTIVLPDGDGTFAATGLTIDSAPAALGYALPIGLADFIEVTENAFTVLGGEIDASASVFFGIFPGFGSAFALRGTDFGAGGRTFHDVATGGFLGDPGMIDLDSSTLRYASNEAVVPLPPAALLLMTGLAGLGLVARRRT